MRTKLITAAPAAVSLLEFQTHAHIDSDNPDTGEGKLAAAHEYIETVELGDRALITSTWELYLERWPCRPWIEVPKGNLQTVAWIKYTDSAGVQQTWDAAEYKVVRSYDPGSDGPNDAGVGRVWLGVNRTWPTAMLDTGEPIVIRFTAGWKDAAAVPRQLKEAVLETASHFYTHRDAVIVGYTAAVDGKELPLSVKAKCSKYAIHKF